MSWATIADISWNARSASWEGRLQEWNGSAASNTFKMDKPRLRRGQGDKETLAPILESVLRVRLKDTDRFLHSKLQNTDFEDLRLLVRKGGSDWGSYLLFKKDGGDEIVYDNPTLKLRFEGGMRRLRKLTWDVKGRYTLLRVLTHILSETRAELPVRTYMRWQTANTDLTSRGESQAIQIPSEDIARNKTVTDYFDALRELCVAFNLQVVQYDGAWHILQRSYRNEEMSWEERDTSGTETAGTFDPRLTQAQASLLEYGGDFPQGRSRDPVPAVRQRFVYSKQTFANADFADTYTDLDGNTKLDRWRAENVTISGDGHPVLDEGIDATTPDVLEQSEDRIFERESPSDRDIATVSAEIVITTQATPDGSEQVNVPYLAVIRRRKHDGAIAEEYWDTSGWLSSPVYLTANLLSVPSSGTTEHVLTFDGLPTIEFGRARADRWELLVKGVTQRDPDGDGYDEVQSIEFRSIELDLSKNTSTPDGETFYVGSADADLKREVALGAWDVDSQVAGMVQYWTGSGWDKSEEWKYDPAESPGGKLGRKSVLEMEAQLNHDLSEVTGAVSYDGASIIDSPEINGLRYVPIHSDEILTHKRRKMTFVEHKVQ